MKKLNKKLIILGIFIILCLVLVFIFINRKEDNKEEIVNNEYEMYLKINPFIKLLINENYKVCDKEVCSDIKTTIKEVSFLNDEAKDIYEEEDFLYKNIKEALVIFYNKALDKDIKTDYITIFTDDKNIDKKELKSYLDDKLSDEVDIILNIQDKMQEDEIKELVEKKKFKVTFDSNGGSFIPGVAVLDGEVVEKVDDPTRDGYKFMGWLLEGKTYDFKTPVTDNITLKADWEKESTNNKTTGGVSSNSSSSTSSSNSSVSPSTIDKINLDENISVIQHSTIKSCSEAYIFVNNLQDVFPQITGNYFKIDDPDGMGGTIITYEDWNNNLDRLQFDTSKEEKATSIFNNIKATPYKGIYDFDYSNNKHLFSYYYSYLTPSDEVYYKSLAEGFKKVRNGLNAKISEALSGSYTVCVGGAGGMDVGELLTPDLCQKYNLVCERW